MTYKICYKDEAIVVAYFFVVFVKKLVVCRYFWSFVKNQFTIQVRYGQMKL